MRVFETCIGVTFFADQPLLGHQGAIAMLRVLRAVSTSDGASAGCPRALWMRHWSSAPGGYNLDMMRNI